MLDQKVETAGRETAAAEAAATDPRASDSSSGGMPPVRIGMGLSAKLLLLTILFVMLAEVLIFLPSVANFRVNWLTDRLTSAQLAGLAAQASPSGEVPQVLRDELLKVAQVKSVAMKRDGQRQLVLQTDMPPTIAQSYDLTPLRQPGLAIPERMEMFWDAFVLFFTRGDRIIRVLGKPADITSDVVEIVLPERPLRVAMLRFGLNVLGLSVIISIITAAMVYFALNLLLVRPILRLAVNMQRFSQNPEDKSRIIEASSRRDEIGTAERELAHMQTELSQLLNQKNRLAALGLAVSKINHDLRNLLANAQLLSDRLTSSPDPTVQSFAPKLIASLDRAINFCNDTLRFGRAAERTPRREMIALRDLADEVGESLGLPREGVIGWRSGVARDLRVDADREHLFRVLNNLARNALQAIEQIGPSAKGEVAIEASRAGTTVVIRVSDDGPGVPPRAREHLFKAFQGSVRRGGTGLGLAIAHELIVAHGGGIRLLDGDRGATFEIVIPDRSSD